MRKYKAGDKIVMEIAKSESNGHYGISTENNTLICFVADHFDMCAKPLSEYTEKLEKKNENKQKRIEKLVERLHRQASEITRLLAENEDLKNSMEIIRDNSFEAGMIKGHEEAWELAIKISLDEMFGGYKVSELKEIFDSMNLEIIFNQTYTEAAAKVAEWELQKEICVGDVVKAKDRKCVEFCVTEIDNEGKIYGISSKGCIYSMRRAENWEKTGRHIDVDAWLKQIGGESE